MMMSVFDRIENIMWEKKKMLVTSIFSFSLNVSKVFLFRVVESWDCVVESGDMSFCTDWFTFVVGSSLKVNDDLLRNSHCH